MACPPPPNPTNDAPRGHHYGATPYGVISGNMAHMTPWLKRRCDGVTPAGRNFKIKKVFCFKLELATVSEALAHTILISYLLLVGGARLLEFGGFRSPPKKSWGVGGVRIRSPPQKVAGVCVGLRGVDGVPMGCGWGADEACLRARGGSMLRGFVDALDR